MACCIGKPSHLAGSCSTAFSEEEEPAAEPDEAEAAHSAHLMHESGAASAITPSANHHEKTAKQRLAQHSTSGGESRRKAYAASQALMTTPCSTECAAAVIYGSSQVRRPRDSASLTIAANPQTRIYSLRVRSLSKPPTEANGHRGPARPRAPPFHLFSPFSLI